MPWRSVTNVAREGNVSKRREMLMRPRFVLLHDGSQKKWLLIRYGGGIVRVLLMARMDELGTGVVV